MERVTREYALGCVVPQRDAAAALDAVAGLLAGTVAIAPRYEEYASLNDVRRLDSALEDVIARARDRSRNRTTSNPPGKP